MIVSNRNLRDVIARFRQFHNSATEEALLIALFGCSLPELFVIFALLADMAL
jgi:hypothetical protein